MNLTQEQQVAFDAAMNAIENNGRLTINGYAGTGKTFLTRHIVDELKKRGINGVVLTAPTHQAKNVLTGLSGKEAYTIHSILKINPVTYEDQVVFDQREIPDLRNTKVLICDEVSMYDSRLFNILMRSAPDSAIIGLGDVAQLAPVNDHEISRFFTSEKFNQVSLTNVIRNGQAIIDVATAVRNGEDIFENTVNDEGVFCLRSDKSIKTFFEQYFKIVKTLDDCHKTKIMCYTNKNVQKLNEIVRKNILKTDDPYVKDEILILQEPVSKTYTYNGKELSETIFNNGEAIKIEAISFGKHKFLFNGMPGQEFDICSLLVRSLDSGIQETLNVFPDEQTQNKFGLFMSKAADRMKTGAIPKQWKLWWKHKAFYTQVGYFPACTIHKMQGSTIENAFLYTPCMSNADELTRQQLLYVGLTRATKNVFYV